MTAPGYWALPFDGKSYLAHRLAWFYYYEEWPNGIVDHINHNRLDNAIINLRDVTPIENSQNRSVRPSKSGIRGIHQAGGYWEVCVVRDDRRYRMGPYKELDKAKMILDKAQSDESWLLEQRSDSVRCPEKFTAARDMDHELLLQLVFYDPLTGYFHHRHNLQKRLGYMCGRYRRIKILNRRYPEHEPLNSWTR